jgi:SUKH superfamily protein
VRELVSLVPLPTTPVDATGEWPDVALPADYRDLVTRYGNGVFNDHVVLLVPFGECTLLGYGVDLLDGDRDLREECDEEDYPYPLYPEPGGLLVWATTTNGARLCWLTTGDPDTWQVIAWDPRAFEYEVHDMGAVAFLEKWLSGALDSDLLPSPHAGAWFDQPRELDQVYLRLTEGPHPYETRLGILRDALAPTADRGGVVLDDGTRQDHFATVTWRVTYETAYGHQVRVAYPPEEEPRVREALSRAADLMGCAVVSATGIDGGTRSGFRQGK